tara:strand:- start:413 stop:826 length:414 start_codon:yes stop_codon:yes gene_type:complete
MSNTLKTILKITIIIILFCFIYNSLNAKRHWGDEDLYQVNVPLFCGETAFMFQTSANKMGEVPLMAGEVRELSSQNGKLLGIISFSYNEETNSGTLMMSMPTSGETCLLAYGLNWTFFNETLLGNKQILDEDNESKQ